MMICNFDNRKLVLYLFNELAPDERTQVDDHVRWCRECEQELAELKNCADFYRTHPAVMPPALHFAEKLDRSHAMQSLKRRRKFRRLVPAFGAVTLIILMTISLLWFFRYDKDARYWSLENSWEGPYRYHFEKIDRTIETIKNDEFFN